MTDKDFLQLVLSGDDTAWSAFYKDCRDLFIAWMKKHYPQTKVDIVSLYSDSIIELWQQIIDGRITESSLQKGKLSTYVIAIGKNKLKEQTRRAKKESEFLNGDLWIKKHHQRKEDNSEPDDPALVLQSKKAQDELQEFVKNDLLRHARRVVIEPIAHNDDEQLESIIERNRFIAEAVDSLPGQCKQLLRDTWYNEMSDAEILEESKGHFSSTDSIKTKRYKCHKQLRSLLEKWHKSFN